MLKLSHKMYRKILQTKTVGKKLQGNFKPVGNCCNGNIRC